MLHRLLLTTALLTLTYPAHATLQIAAQIGPDSFFCADGQPCDDSPAPNVITTSPTILDGIVFSPSSASSASGSENFLNASSLLITNTTSAPINITVTASNINFVAPTFAVSTAGSGVWQGPGGSFATLSWFVDPANTQGANNAFDTPGTLVNSDLSTSIAPILSFSQNVNGISQSLLSPYSMTEQISIHLGAGESLVNRGQTIVSTAIPEPATWAMILVGFIGLSCGALTRKRTQANCVDE